MLLTYCAVKVMEILNRKRNFPDQTEISVLRYSYFSDRVSSKEVTYSFSLR